MAVSTRFEVVVAGGGYAGTLAALRVAGKLKNRARVTLVDVKDHLVERIRLHEHAAGSMLATRPYAALLGNRARHQRGLITGVDVANARLRVDGAAQGLAFDALILCTGSVAARSIPGAREHAHAVGDLEGAMTLRAALQQQRAGTGVTVLGGGLTGLELATELASRTGRPVTLVCTGVLGPTLSPAARVYTRKHLEVCGITVVEHAQVTLVEEDGVVLSDGSRIPHGVCALALGLAPSPLARACGLPVTSEGQLCVDPALRVRGIPNVWGAGDLVAVDGLPLRMACASAMPMGAHAADNVARALTGMPPQRFDMRFLGHCVSLGRQAGVVEWSAAQPEANTVFTGRTGARLKEAVCRYTMFSMSVENLLPGTYTWPRAVNAAAGHPTPDGLDHDHQHRAAPEL